MRLAITAAALVVASGVAMAQTSPNTPNTAGSASPPPAAQPTTAPGITTPTPNTPPGAPMSTPASTRAPAAGSNSFTQRQAMNRIRRAGYTNVAGLKKDNKGIWRGTAQKDGNTVNVSLDFKGNVSTQ